MEYTILILLLPLLSFLLLGIGGKWMTHRTAGFIGTAVLGVVAVLSYVTAVQYFSAPRLEDGTFATWIPYNFEWLPFTETLTFNIGILLDPISVMMLIVISTVSLMVHIYSFGYMKGEKGFQRYYAFLSLFTMSMLGLVVSSYLLIGFYYTKPAAIAASKKAFIVTRFADLGFLIGILIYGYYGGTFGFTPDTVSLISGGASMLPLALGLMFVGGAGKSAMFPLHIWLPDAMEGPTPGFMIVALGVCTSADPHHGGLGYMASMFHLFTHAMFKALLFLGAGSIIHAVHSNEMSAMGGLRKYMPITHITFLIACLAIAGIPPFSGFFSKDEILAACFQFSPVMGWIMTVIAAMTAFYMFRLYYGIFWGKDNSKQSSHTPHESPTAMTIPLIFLALVTCGAGFIPFGHFISSNGESYTIHLDWTVAGTSIVIALLSIALATYMYKGSKQPVADSLQRRFSGLWTAAYHRFYIDEVYQFITHKIIFRCISKPIAWFDRHVIDGTFDFIAWAANAASDSIRGFQSGQIQQYTYVFLCGALALILLLIL